MTRLLGIVTLCIWGLSGCSDGLLGPGDEARAETKITDEFQHEMTATEKTAAGYDPAKTKYSDVKVYYRVKNTGEVEIDDFTLWIEVKCKDGSTYTNPTTGGDVPVGQSLTGNASVSTAGKKMQSVKISDEEIED